MTGGKNNITLEIYRNRNDIAHIIESGEAVTVTDIKKWVKDNGFAEARDRNHFSDILKSIFPEYVVGGRWNPVRSIVESQANAEETPDDPAKKPMLSAKAPPDKKPARKEEKKEDDDKVIRVLEDGTEIGEKALEFFDRRTIMESSELTLHAFFMRKVRAKKYMRKKAEENDQRQGNRT
ncbi:hypothetical protein [Vreelandella jeotgali]|uniref:hypothetical protein n=1 Tax=Vreelandella jeotgali TaxID=553386 RepID=UPI0012E99566|nr:hypothetical protein [Halomonas jeotgali]